MSDTALTGDTGIEGKAPRRFITIAVINDAGSVSEKETIPLAELGEWVKGRLVGETEGEGLCLTIELTDEAGDPGEA